MAGRRRKQKRSTLNDGDLVSAAAKYGQVLAALKQRIQAAQLRAGLAVNSELVLLYWHIGTEILQNQKRQGWGAKVIDRLSVDLRDAFPRMQGFSPRNLKYMRAFAEAWPEVEFVQRAVAQIPWGHNVRILDHMSDRVLREFYVQKTIEYGWSRDVLEHQMGTGLHKRLGKAQSNFTRTLPSPQSDLAKQVLKDPYNFDFLTLSSEAEERELEEALIKRLRDFLLELGVGFSFVGNQYRLDVGGDEFFIDLLFYHLKLRAYVVIELKTTKFKPEYSGKMNFYLSAVDDILRHPDDKPSIGIILCRAKNEVVVEYALRDTTKPIGISGYTVKEVLPPELTGSLPSVRDLEQQLESVKAETGKLEKPGAQDS